jgi:hypothetical protein
MEITEANEKEAEGNEDEDEDEVRVISQETTADFGKREDSPNFGKSVFGNKHVIITTHNNNS